MLRILILSLLSTGLTVVLADSTCSNGTSSPMTPFLFADEILMKLQMELNLIRTSEEVLRLRLEANSMRLDKQTCLLNQIVSKLGNNCDSNVNSSSPASCTSIVNAKNTCPTTPPFPSSCDAIADKSGIYTIQISLFSVQPFLVFCNTLEQGGGWTVIQRRVDESVDFYRGWDDYKNGFGDLNGNFWIGNDKLHSMTNATATELLITLTDFENVTKMARYNSFQIGNEAELYVMNDLGEYSGDAGDSFSTQKGMKFTTKDKDNDVYSGNCALLYKGGWWYRDCHSSNLNGLYLKGNYSTDLYAQGIVWYSLRGHYYSFKTVNMMIRSKRN